MVGTYCFHLEMNEKIAESLIETEELIIKCLVDFRDIDGAQKLKRKLEAEKKFLISVSRPIIR